MEYGQYACDCFVVKLIGPGSQEDWNREAELFLRQILAWIRIKSGQWWAGRPTRPPEEGAQLSMPLSEENIIEGTINAVSQGFYISALDIKPITQNLWMECVTSAAGQPPGYDAIMSDIVYYFASKEYLTAVMMACGLLEAMRDGLFDRKKRNVRGTDLPKQLSTNLEAVFNRNLQKEDKETYDFLDSLWAARGHIAHGKQFFWKSDKGATNPPKDFLQNLKRLYEWLCSV